MVHKAFCLLFFSSKIGPKPSQSVGQNKENNWNGLMVYGTGIIIQKFKIMLSTEEKSHSESFHCSLWLWVVKSGEYMGLSSSFFPHTLS